MIQYPAFIVTLALPRDQEDILQTLLAHLVRAQEKDGLDLEAQADGSWINEEMRTLLTVWSPVETPELTLVQLALNEEGAGSEGWTRARTRYQRAIAGLPASERDALLGRTLVYQALVDEPPDQVAATIWKRGVLTTENGLALRRPLAAALDAPGGAVWLLATPGDGRIEAIYLALGPAEEQDTLVFNVLFGPEAALPAPDVILHQAHHLSAPYLAMRRDRVLQAVDDLQTRSVSLLTLPQPPSDQELRDIQRSMASMATILAEIQRLHSSLEVLAVNHKRVMASLPWLQDIGHYQQIRLDAMLQRISHDVRETQSVLNAAQAALQSLETDYASRRAAAQERTNLILVVIGLLLALLQIIDADASTMRWRLLAVIFFLAAFVGWFLVRRRIASDDESGDS